MEIKQSMNLSMVAVEAFKNLSTWREMMPTFESTAMLLEVLDKVLDLVPRNSELSDKLSMLATQTLSYRWPPSTVVKVRFFHMNWVILNKSLMTKECDPKPIWTSFASIA